MECLGSHFGPLKRGNRTRLDFNARRMDRCKTTTGERAERKHTSRRMAFPLFHDARYITDSIKITNGIRTSV